MITGTDSTTRQHQTNITTAKPWPNLSRDVWRRLWPIVWCVLSCAAIALFVVALPARFAEIQVPSPQAIAAREVVGIAPVWVAVYLCAIEIGLALAYVATGLLIVLGRPLMVGHPREPMAWFTSLGLMLAGVTLPPTTDALTVAHGPWAWWATLLSPLTASLSLLFCFTFPNGRFVPAFTRSRASLLLAGLTALTLLLIFYDQLFPDSLEPWVGIAFVFYAVGIVVQVYRYRFVSTLLERQQAKWLVFGLVTALLNFALLVGYFIIPDEWPTGFARQLYVLALYPIFYGFAPLVVLLSIAAAIFQYRLWDVDVVLNRSLVYGTLSLMVVLGYVLAVAVLDALFRTTITWWVSLIATGVVALLFHPLRQRLQRLVNQHLYGEANDPQTVLRRLGETLKRTAAPDDVLPNITEALARSLKLPYAAVILTQEGRSRIAAEYFDRGYGTSLDSTSHWLRLPLTYQAEIIGELRLAPRAGQGHFSPKEAALLRDIAHQAGLVAHTLRLTQDLKAANEQLVFAHAEERRRLRRELHDGLGPTLAELAMQIETARNLVSDRPAEAAQLLDELSAQARATIDEVRDIVRHLRPPALDELGLVPLIEEVAARAERAGLAVTLLAPASLPVLPAATENAAYRILQEAVTNTLWHAQAHACTITLDLTAQALRVEINDDGRGLTPSESAGLGLRSIRERVEEIGGRLRIESGAGLGTKLNVWLPLRRRSDGAMA